jgi:hypothetical protein
MTLAGYKNAVPLLADGDSVDANTNNRVLGDLFANTTYIKDLVEAALLGSTQFAFGQSVEESALVGQPVYYRASTQQFERALAAAVTDGETGLLTTAESSQSWGIVFRKHSSTSADILLSGFAQLDLSNAVDETVEAGIYYLSAVEAGKMQKTSPPVGIPVLRATGEGTIYVFPSFTDSFLQHRHYKFDLVAYPSGEHVDPEGDVHAITAADDSIEGWLPADNAVFEGNAPTGAKFGYNIAASPLATVWPPVPIGSAYIEWNKGLDPDVGGTGTQQGTTAPLVVVDNNGIWWMSDAYGDVPWPKTLDTSSSVSLDPTPGENPREMAMTLTLWFTKMQFITDSTVVTSLQAGSSKVSITCLHGSGNGSTGDLVIDLNLEALVDPDDDEEGDLVFKRYDEDTQTFFRGPVVSSLRAGTNVTLSSDNEDDPDYRGTVTVNASLLSPGYEFAIEEVRLNGVEEENYGSTLGLGFPAGRDSELRAKFRVPGSLSGYSGATVKLRFQFLARASGDLPDFTVARTIIPQPTTAAPLPSAATVVALDMSAGAGIAIDEYIEIETAAFAVTAGDQVLFGVSRLGSEDGFAGSVHIIDMRAVVASFVE